MLTARGICYNLRESPYFCCDTGFLFYFSSQYHLDKFNRMRQEAIDSVNTTLSNRYGFTIKFPEIGLLHLYRRIESRGFYICYEGGEVTCLSKVVLNGENRTPQNYPQKLGSSTLN